MIIDFVIAEIRKYAVLSNPTEKEREELRANGFELLAETEEPIDNDLPDPRALYPSIHSREVWQAKKPIRSKIVKIG